MILSVEFVEFMPEKKEDGVLYVSDKFQLAIHNCPCGCGTRAVTPLGEGGWSIEIDCEVVTLRPSILNRSCGTHYWVRKNEVVWA
jgi:hypothetical protein